MSNHQKHRKYQVRVENSKKDVSETLKSVLELRASKRNKCQCLATQHPLIANCTNCGRIVCESENSGPCFTCSEIVCTKEERLILEKGNKKSEELRRELSGVGHVTLKDVSDILRYGDCTKSEEMKKAVEHRDKLLGFNKTAERRTKVVDDAADYYGNSSNKWISASLRETFQQVQMEEQEKRHSRRHAVQVTMDFTGRNVVEETPKSRITDMSVEELLEDDFSIFDCPYTRDEFNDESYRPKYVVAGPKFTSRKAETVKEKLRIQNSDLQFMSDQGMCISIQQPYASLVVTGIKTHEGRTWYTSFRGRLWIHSSKTVSTEDVSYIEKFYHLRNEFRKVEIEFPESYPTGQLLGCVDIVDCIPQSDYCKLYPKGECGTEFVFIFENPVQLKVNIPMSGKRDIFKMPREFHEAAKKTLSKLGQKNEIKFL